MRAELASFLVGPPEHHRDVRPANRVKAIAEFGTHCALTLGQGRGFPIRGRILIWLSVSVLHGVGVHSTSFSRKA